MTQVEFLWWRGCPSWERALAMLRAEMARLAMDPEAVDVVEIGDEEQARRLGFPGSPTIRVGGADVQPTEGREAGLSCRVYRRRDGRVSPLPDPEDIRDALKEAA